MSEKGKMNKLKNPPFTPPKDEWHMTRRNVRIIQRIVGEAYGEKYGVQIAHHLCIWNVNTGKLLWECPSVETLMFDHGVVKKIFGEKDHACWNFIYDLAAQAPTNRLEFFNIAINVRNRHRRIANKKTKAKLS